MEDIKKCDCCGRSGDHCTCCSDDMENKSEMGDQDKSLLERHECCVEDECGDCGCGCSGGGESGSGTIDLKDGDAFKVLDSIVSEKGGWWGIDASKEVPAQMIAELLSLIKLRIREDIHGKASDCLKKFLVEYATTESDEPIKREGDDK